MSLYDKLPNDVLIEFYYEISSNIERNVLTERMYVELELIDEVAKRRGITIIKKRIVNQ
ncbi:hypothetical protein [Bacillus sp. FJAT-45350]|uniref:hypothetical protein n=1 Tax=Bacillus sp. FJAT-45350 TaxID=2011014 RepID=UPI0015CAC7BD|nr:hypothetical protein [Bacillus sp. FJAT-45350]